MTELLDRAAHDAERTYPGLRVSLVPSPAAPMVGLPAGLRLVIDNAIANAVKHGGATRIRLSVSNFADQIRVTVDDNGTGVPEQERTAVFERFARGSTAARSGSDSGSPSSPSRPNCTAARPRWRPAPGRGATRPAAG